MLRECHAVHQPLGRRSDVETPLMELPQQLDFGAHVILPGDDIGICVPTHDAMGQLVDRQCRVRCANYAP
jgi:hypothetical protein